MGKRPDPALLLLEPQHMHGKSAAGVRPRSERAPARAARQRQKRFNRVFVAVLGVDRLAETEVDHPPRHLDFLTLLAGEVHLDAMALCIIEGVMTESGGI